jgi:hypothetical protein
MVEQRSTNRHELAAFSKILVIIGFEPGGSMDWVGRPDTAERQGGHSTPKETVMKEVTAAGFQVMRAPESWRGRTYGALFRRP